jgi:hypothetical protein
MAAHPVTPLMGRIVVVLTTEEQRKKIKDISEENEIQMTIRENDIILSASNFDIKFFLYECFFDICEAFYNMKLSASGEIVWNAGKILIKNSLPYFLFKTEQGYVFKHDPSQYDEMVATGDIGRQAKLEWSFNCFWRATSDCIRPVETITILPNLDLNVIAETVLPAQAIPPELLSIEKTQFIGQIKYDNEVYVIGLVHKKKHRIEYECSFLLRVSADNVEWITYIKSNTEFIAVYDILVHFCKVASAMDASFALGGYAMNGASEYGIWFSIFGKMYYFPPPITMSNFLEDSVYQMLSVKINPEIVLDAALKASIAAIIIN